uniref:DNA-directed RNA polymerase III subunit RPC9 n=1 Tax=Guillardia theta TaxID=55529 RepID=A0A7S4KQM2_GUITH
MEILDDCDAVLCNAEVLELVKSIQLEASKSGFQRPEVAVLTTNQVIQYLESSNSCNVTPNEVQQLYGELAKFPPLDGQEPLKKKELLNIANFRPTTLVSLYSIIDHAEARFGDDRLEQMIALVEKILSAPPEVESEVD